MKTYNVKPQEVERAWFEVDAAGKTVGRLATEIARVLMGKHKPTFSQHVDVGDFVIVTNCDQVEFTGDKWRQKTYYRHSGYPGGITATTAEQMKNKHPERILRFAVRGMLPKNRLRDPRLNRLKIYSQANHPHVAQKPQPFPGTQA